jgi:hypothetical protein
MAPSIPARCSVTSLFDEATAPTVEVVLALTPRRAVVATRGHGGRESFGAGTLWDIDRASGMITRIPVEGAEVATARGDEAWVAFLSHSSLRFHRLEAGEHDAASSHDFSIGYTVPHMLTTRDDGVFLLADKFIITEQGIPMGGLLAVDSSGVIDAMEEKRPNEHDAPFLGVVPRGQRTVVLRRDPGPYGCPSGWALLFLNSRLEVEREVLTSAPLDTCERHCQPLVRLGSDMVTGCSDGALIVLNDAGQTRETARLRPIRAIGALEHQLVVVTDGRPQPSGEYHEVVIESPPGTPLARFGYGYSYDGPRVATSGNDALIAWASRDARGIWYVHARLMTCR